MSRGQIEDRRHTYAVPVAGGDLCVGVWEAEDGAEDAPTVVCLHGITSSHLAFRWLAEALPGWRIIAPDLRGRAGSADLDGPFGMAAHADDVRAVIDHFGLGPVPVLGHSMGAFVAVVLAHRHPDHVSRLLLVDGGLPIPTPPGLDPDELLQAVIGPAAERLAMRFPSREAYREFWQQHPAFTADWNEDVGAYVDYDLVGEPPEMRASAAYEAVRDDSTDLHRGTAYLEAVQELTHPAEFIRAERGMLDQPGGLYPSDALAELVPPGTDLPVTEIAGVNHYTIVMTERGASAVASHVWGADTASRGSVAQ